MNASTIKVSIIGDSHIMRTGVRKILEVQTTIRVLEEVSVKRARPDLILRHGPDVVLIDLDPRAADVLRFIGSLHEASEHPAVLILSDLADSELACKAMAAGASGIVLKSQPPSLLIAAILELSPASRDDSGTKNEAMELTHTVKGRRLIQLSGDAKEGISVDSLTVREQEIIRLVALGLKNKDIANRLSISDITVRHHLTSIFCKLGVEDRQKLLILAYRYGLVDLSEAPTLPG